MALVTAAQARLHVPELSGTDEDTNLDTVIARVGGAFARYCGYPPATVGVVPSMESVSRVLYIDGPGGRDLVVPVWPVTAIGSIYDSPDHSYGASHLVASGDYTLINGDMGLIELDYDAAHGAWTTGKRNIKATVTAGFSTVPADLQLAAVMAVKHVWDTRRSQGRTNASQQGVSIGYRDEELLPPAVREVLSPFRLPWVHL